MGGIERALRVMMATTVTLGMAMVPLNLLTGRFPSPGALIFVAAILGGVAAVLDAVLRDQDGKEAAEPALAMPAARLRHLRREPAPMTDADRAFATALVAGVRAQVDHERDLIDARGREPVVVRLVPRIPAQPDHAVRSWLGGAPALAEGQGWPEQDGTLLVFLGQLDCAALPPEIWDGLGPRSGALLFFCHPQTAAPTVLHVARPGAVRENRGAGDACFFYPRPSSRDEDGPDPIRAFPRWPVDLVAVRPGDDDPRAGGQDRDRHALYDAGYDLTDPGHRPFDWPSTLAMLDVLERKTAYFWRPLPPGPSRLEWQVHRNAAALAAAEAAAEPPADLQRRRNAAIDLPELIRLAGEARAAIDAARAAVAPIIAEARVRATTLPFTPDEPAAIIAKLSTIEWIKLLRLTDPARGDGAERFELVRLPLTRHDPRASLWVHDFEQVRLDMARHAYADDPDRLPPPVRDHYEARWATMAAHEMAGTGHVPFRFVHEFDEAEDVVLLELPSSDLLGWMWGDVDHLVLTMRKADLAAGHWDRVRMQVTN